MARLIPVPEVQLLTEAVERDVMGICVSLKGRREIEHGEICARAEGCEALTWIEKIRRVQPHAKCFARGRVGRNLRAVSAGDGEKLRAMRAGLAAHLRDEGFGHAPSLCPVSIGRWHE